MSTYVIGDVQGCYIELTALLAAIHFSPENDQLWFVGDLVNKGPASLAVLRFIKTHDSVCKVVLGNHDLHLLAVACHERTVKLTDTFTDVLQAEDRDSLLEWLRQQPLLHYDSAFNIVMVHAGIYPSWTLAKAQALANEVEIILRSKDYRMLLATMYGDQPNCWREELQGVERYRFIINVLTRMRYLDQSGHLDLKAVGPVGSQAVGLEPWYEWPNQKEADLTVVFGHWAALNGVTQLARYQALDTGCVWGGALTAWRLEDNKRFKVEAKNDGSELQLCTN